MTQNTADSATEAAIRLCGLRMQFGGLCAVDDVSFEVARGSFVGLIGPNGAGKSTLLNIVAGAIRPTAGSLMVNGKELAGRPAHVMARHGVVRTFQLSGEFARLTVIENLMMGAYPQRGETLLGALLGRRFWDRQERELLQVGRQLLDRFGFARFEDEYAGELSGGQRRIVEILRAMMAQPKVLLLDEPMAGVNKSLALDIEAYLMELHAQGTTILMIEHELGCVERLCEDVIVMADGRVLSRGSMADARSRREVLDAYLAG